MKHTIIAAVLALSAIPAMAQSEAGVRRICPVVADAAVVVSQGASLGVPWEETGKGYKKLLDESTSDLDRNIYGVTYIVVQEAYFKYSAFSTQDIKRLAYMKCDLEFLKIRNSK